MRSYRTKLHQEDVALWRAWRRKWGACVVKRVFAYSDDDLSDFWHLCPEGEAEHTRAVATAWLRTCGTKH